MVRPLLGILGNPIEESPKSIDAWPMGWSGGHSGPVIGCGETISVVIYRPGKVASVANCGSVAQLSSLDSSSRIIGSSSTITSSADVGRALSSNVAC